MLLEFVFVTLKGIVVVGVMAAREDVVSEVRGSTTPSNVFTVVDDARDLELEVGEKVLIEDKVELENETGMRGPSPADNQ